MLIMQECVSHTGFACDVISQRGVCSVDAATLGEDDFLDINKHVMIT